MTKQTKQDRKMLTEARAAMTPTWATIRSAIAAIFAAPVGDITDDMNRVLDRIEIDRADHDRKRARENMTRVQPGWYAEWLLMKYGREIIVLHKPDCNSQSRDEWRGSPNPRNPDNEWVCDDCGAIIPASAP